LKNSAPSECQMGLKEDLQTEVDEIVRVQRWTLRDGQVVPEPEDLQLGNDGINLEATVLYADISGSTQLVDDHNPHFAAEVYKTYLSCGASIIKNYNGVITAYDGDRVMGVFIGDRKNTNAVTSALKINAAVSDIIKPALDAQYPTSGYTLKHVIGIDTSKLLVGRIGVRNDNDLVWIGRAANYAAKLSSLSNKYAIYITDSVYGKIADTAKYGDDSNTQNMWTKLTWTQMGNMTIYGSTWQWNL
jgi:class 3 adenylate cyclase